MKIMFSMKQENYLKFEINELLTDLYIIRFLDIRRRKSFRHYRITQTLKTTF